MITYFSNCCKVETDDSTCPECDKDSGYYKVYHCRGCKEPHAQECHDYYGITTGYWCDSCYNSDKYPYKKDRYPTIEHDGYGERLDDE
jgi:hypothetical protein